MSRLVLMLTVILALAGCVERAENREPPRADGEGAFSVYTDSLTGCQYLNPFGGGGITPRIAADGETHMGCKGAKP